MEIPMIRAMHSLRKWIRSRSINTINVIYKSAVVIALPVLFCFCRKVMPHLWTCNKCNQICTEYVSLLTKQFQQTATNSKYSEQLDFNTAYCLRLFRESRDDKKVSKCWLENVLWTRLGVTALPSAIKEPNVCCPLRNAHSPTQFHGFLPWER